MTHADCGVLAAAPQPEMPAVHKKLDPVFFGGDWIRIRLRYALQHLHATDIHFVSARSSLFSPDLPGQDEGALLRQVFEGLENFLRKFRFHAYALHNPGSVAKLGKHDFSVLAKLVKPSGEFYCLSGVFTRLRNRDAWRVTHRAASSAAVSNFSKISQADSIACGNSGASFNSSSSGYCSGLD